jgi:hypothetical protein
MIGRAVDPGRWNYSLARCMKSTLRLPQREHTSLAPIDFGAVPSGPLGGFGFDLAAGSADFLSAIHLGEQADYTEARVSVSGRLY